MSLGGPKILNVSAWVAFSPDGRPIVSDSDDHTIRVWDASAGEVMSGPFEGCSDDINSVAFSPDGKHIISGSDDHMVCVLEANMGMMISGPLEGHTDCVNSVAFSADDKRITSGSEKIFRV
jgi:WD40 repeat protein